MADKNKESGVVSYILGIVSIVLAFFQPLAGLIFGIIGLTISKKASDDLSKKGKKFSVIGIILSVIILIASLTVAWYVARTGFGALQNFPIA